MSLATDLVTQLQTLVGKINVFVNGSENVTVSTDAGALKTLSGLVKQLEQVQYLQKVRDYLSASEMASAVDEFTEGELARVLADPDQTRNGIYQYQTVGGFIKQSYGDLLNLHDYLPNPWNNIEKSFSAADLAAPVKFGSVRIAISASEFESTSFSGKIDYIRDNAGSDFVATEQFLVTIAAKSAPVFVTRYAVTGSNNFAPATIPGYVAPKITATHSIDGSVHVFDLYLTPASGTAGTLAGHANLMICNVNMDKVQFL